jgi:hypothetical protein
MKKNDSLIIIIIIAFLAAGIVAITKGMQKPKPNTQGLHSHNGGPLHTD